MGGTVNRRGITLVEMVVVMAIIAIAALLTFPNLGSVLQRNRLRAAARDIGDYLMYARSEAIKTGVECRVSFDLNAQTYVLQRWDDANGVWNDDEGVKTLPSGVTIASDSISGRHFNPDGSTDTGTADTSPVEATVVLQNSKGEQYRVILYSTTGQVKVTEG